MKGQPTVFLFLIAWFAASHQVNSEELPLFGELPNPGKNWKMCLQGKRADSAFHWVVLTNAESGDLLSFASHKFDPGEKRELIYLSDTAHEILPGGLPVWLSVSNQRFATYSLRSSVTELSVIADKKDFSREALEYSFVQAGEEITNRMAHGYAVIFGSVVVFVQHTSTKPITWDLAQEMALGLVSSRSRQNAATKTQCIQNMEKLWTAGSFYCLETKKTGEDLITPTQFAEHFSERRPPKCPLGDIDYPPFTVATGPRCPHRPDLHSGVKRLKYADWAKPK